MIHTNMNYITFYLLINNCSVRRIIKYMVRKNNEGLYNLKRLNEGTEHAYKGKH